MPEVPPPPKAMRTLRGIAVSPGVAVGSPRVIDPHAPKLANRAIAAAAIPDEIQRLRHGLEAAQSEARRAEAEARARLGPEYADILAAHVRMIADPGLLREAAQRIETDLAPAELALFDVLNGYARRLEDLTAAHLAARAADVRDILRRILDQFLEQPARDSPAVEGDPVVLLAHDLTPSETAALEPARVLGFATEAGGRTSHTAIVAAALEIPAVVGLGRFLDSARDCRHLIVDGDEGLLVLDPDPATLDRYRHAAHDRAARFARLARQANLPAVTRDGVRIPLLGNIEFPAEAAACRDRGADGIGLYRTEFLYLNAHRAPTEDEQAAAYEAVVRSIPGRPVTIRTLDLGSDKATDHAAAAESNPALGLRSLRRSLREPVAFRTQLRAILRASAAGDVRIMFPLVTTLTELRQARELVHEAAESLRAEGRPCRADLPIGAMIEVPAAAVTADLLAQEADFFSIGTNDLIQYALAADRTNENVADLYSAADPAVLRLIAQVAAAARAAGIDVGVCGSMAGEALYTLPLLGFGISHLSTPPHQLPEIKRLLRAVDLGHARDVAEAALRCATADEVIHVLSDALFQALPETSAPHRGSEPTRLATTRSR